MFIRCQTQWRPGPSGVLGLDYGVVLSMMTLYAVENPAQAMEDLQVIEARALELLNDTAKPARTWDAAPPPAARGAR